MISPFDFWALQFKAPFSGDVTQTIEPRVLSPDYKGVPELEHQIQTEVASYGKQLGKILDALLILSERTDIDLPDIRALHSDVEDIKAKSTEALKAHARTALERLKSVDEAAWKEIVLQG
jgi:hypothetical protein